MYLDSYFESHELQIEVIQTKIKVKYRIVKFSANVVEKRRHFLYAKLINIEAIMVLKTTFIGFKNNTTLKTF